MLRASNLKRLEEGKLEVLWQTISQEETLAKLSTQIEGLSFSQVKERLRKFGENQIELVAKKDIWELAVLQFKSPLVYLLLFSALLTSILDHNLDTAVILIVVFSNALIGFFQEYKAEKSVLALRKLVIPKAKVIREEDEHLIASTQVVPGDMVILEEGFKVPADLRILESTSLKINEAILTGESIPQAKERPTLAKETPLADRINMAYAGTLVVAGRGKGVAVQTGNRTEFGKIAKEVVAVKEPETYLEKKMREFAKLLLWVALLTAIFLVILGKLSGTDLVSMILVGVAMVVSIIPEGLPAVITVALASGVLRLSRHKTVIKRLSAIETLGAVTAILTDKTGTLTSGQMNIRKILIPPHIFDLSGEGYQPQGEFYLFSKKTRVALYPQLQLLLKLGTLCNNANLIEKEGQWEILGDPTEGALLSAAEKAQIFKSELEEKYPRLDEIPFSTVNLYMATLHQDPSSKEKLMAVKGAAEKILNMSGSYENLGKIYKMTANSREFFLKQSLKFANSALRVLAVAYKKTKSAQDTLVPKDISNLIFVGFVGMIDPPSASAVQAVGQAKEAGIRTLMITGDHQLTALQVAKQVGIYNRPDPIASEVISGEQLAKTNEVSLRNIVNKVLVFARVSPWDKLRITKALQRNGEVVAVTGDGVNDAPALKRADVGVAMGRRGNDVSREAAEVVLQNDNFSNIISAVAEGRTVSQNIKRVIFFLLSTNAGEALILILALLLGLPLPLTAVQILWINLITDGLNTVPLVFEKSHVEVLKMPPRSPQEPILTKILKDRIALVALIMAAVTIPTFWLALSQGQSLNQARSLSFALMGVLQIYNVFNSRSFKNSVFQIPFFSNPAILGTVLVSLALTYATVSFVPLKEIFQTESLSSTLWLWVFLFSLLIILGVEIEKWWRRKNRTVY